MGLSKKERDRARKFKDKIIESGFRLDCNGCVTCCCAHQRPNGSYGYVYLSASDRRRMANYLGMPTREFTRAYCDKHDGWFHLKNPEKDCRFLLKTGLKPGCSIYDARPTQCRTWPFWPENLNQVAWNREVLAICNKKVVCQ